MIVPPAAPPPNRARREGDGANANPTWSIVDGNRAHVEYWQRTREHTPLRVPESAEAEHGAATSLLISATDFIEWSPKEVVLSINDEPNLPPNLEFHDMSVRKIGGLYLGIVGEFMAEPLWSTDKGNNWRDHAHAHLGLPPPPADRVEGRQTRLPPPGLLR